MKALQLRSPLNVSYSSEDSSFASCEFSIFVNRDVTDIDTTTVPDYSLIAEPINNRVNFEIAELIRSKNDYLYEDDFYTARDTATYVLLRAVLLDSDGDEIETKYNFFKVRDGYVERNEVQLLDSEVNPDPRTWINNASITSNQVDPFSGNDGYFIEDRNSVNKAFLLNTLQLSGIYTLSCFFEKSSPEEVLIGNGFSHSITVDMSDGSLKTVRGNVIAYDIFKIGQSYKVSVVVNMELGDQFRISEETAPDPFGVMLFNPTIIKGNLLNFTPSEVLLQSNTQVFSHTSIRPSYMLDRKESVAYIISNSTPAYRDLRAFFIDNPLVNSAISSVNERQFFLINQILKIPEEILCEIKYTPVKVSFINKFGVIQDLVFFKKREDSFNTNQQDFKANILRNGTYLPHTGQKQIINKQASAKVKLNTGFYPEEFNEVFKQLQYSINYWIDDEPAILTGSNFAFKTSVNDKLINYSFDFEYANPDINDIR
jgi:hypothetical protein